jgi:PAS domain S-box-containing protein
MASPDKRILERGLEIPGYLREEFLGLHIVDLVVPQHTGRLPAIIARLKSGQPEIIESSLWRKDGSRLAGEVSPRLMLGGNSLGIIRDLTERRYLEQQIRQAHKLSGIGRLAGGVAHDFNNLLPIISGYARMGLDDLPAGDELRESLIEIDKAAARATFSDATVADLQSQPIVGSQDGRHR